MLFVKAGARGFTGILGMSIDLCCDCSLEDVFPILNWEVLVFCFGGVLCILTWIPEGGWGAVFVDILLSFGGASRGLIIGLPAQMPLSA